MNLVFCGKELHVVSVGRILIARIQLGAFGVRICWSVIHMSTGNHQLTLKGPRFLCISLCYCNSIRTLHESSAYSYTLINGTQLTSAPYCMRCSGGLTITLHRFKLLRGRLSNLERFVNKYKVLMYFRLITTAV